MADNNKVVVELGRVIKNRGEYNPDASPLVKYFEENIVQKQGNSYIAYPTALVNDGVLDGKYYLTRAPYNDDPQTPNAGWEIFASGKHNFKTGEDIEDVSIATGSDFTNPDATKRAKVPTVGAILDGLNDGIYDVSKRNPTAGPNSDGKFTLEYILNNANTLIPTSWRHGGMIIRFVDSSDNKYVEYFLTKDEWTTDISYWQKINIEDVLTGAETKDITWTNGRIEPSGLVGTIGTTFQWSQPILLKKGESVTVKTSSTASLLTTIGTTTNSSISEGDTITPIYKIETSNTEDSHTFIAYEDMKVVLCVKKDDYTVSFNSGNGYNDIIKKIPNEMELMMGGTVDLTKYDRFTGMLGTTTWAVVNGYEHIVIPISRNYLFKFISNTTIKVGFLTDYSIPSNGDTISYCEQGGLVVLKANKETIIQTPNDANYIVLTVEIDNYEVSLSVSILGVDYLVDNAHALYEMDGIPAKVSNLENTVEHNSLDIESIKKTIELENYQYGKEDASIIGVLKSDNTVLSGSSYNNYRTSEKISIYGLRYLIYEGLFINTDGWAGLLLLDLEDNVLANFGSSGTVDLLNYPLAKSFRFCYQTTTSSVSVVESDSTSVNKNKVEKIEETVVVLENEFDTIDKLLFDNNGNGTFGEDTTNTPNQNFVEQTLLVTVGDSYSNIKKGYISKIRLWVVNNCTATFFVGRFDQNHYAMNTRPFTVTLNAGYNEVDIYDKRIIINENEQLFILMGSGVVLKYYTPSQSVSYEVYAGSPNGVLRPYSEQAPVSFPNGLCINMSWDVDGKVPNTLTENDLSEINDRIDTQAIEINKMQYIIDPVTKIPYKLFIVNGEVVPRAQVFSKVLAIGNSLTDHYATENYPTHGYSMAASSKETSWTYQFERVLKQYVPNAVVTPFYGIQWEENPTGNPAQIVNLDGNVPLSTYLADNPDCIIFKLGENYNHSTSVYKEGLETLLDYLIAQCPSATIIICSLFWHNERDTVFAQVAEEYGLKYVNTGAEAGTFLEMMGDYCYNQDRTSVFPIVTSGVAGHMTDLGFYIWNRVLTESLGFTQLQEELHEIHVTSAVTFNLKDMRGGKYMGVYRGLISILTYEATAPTVTVEDASHNSITVTAHDMSQVTQTWENKPTYVFTFDMPDSDVFVNITT